MRRGSKRAASRGIVVRALTMRDYDAMIELQKLCGLHVEKRIRESRDAVRRQMAFNRGLSFGAFDGERMVAVARGSFDSRRGYVDRVAVHPEYRRMGLGSRIVERVERELWRRGGRFIVVSALVEPDNQASKRMFERMGFEAIPVLYMRKRPARRR